MMAAVTLDVVRRLTVQGQTVGMDKVAADLQRVEAGQDAVAQSSARLVTATATTERSVLGVGRQLDNYTKSLDPLSRALAQQERGERLAAAARAQGVALTEGQARAMANAAARVEELKRSTEGHTASMGLNRAASMQLRAATTSMFDQIQAGTPILTAARIQAGDFYEALASDKDGVVGGLRQVAGSIGRSAAFLLNPFAMATAGAVAFTVAAVLAVRSYDELQRREARALSGVGRASGLSVGGLDTLASRSAAQTGVGMADSRSNAIALAGTGQLSAQNIGGALGLTRGYAGAFQTSFSEAGTQLADIFSDPVKGAEKLNERLGFLDDRTRQYIASLKAQGDQQGAVNALIAAATPALNEQVEKVGLLDRLWQRIKDNNDQYGALLSKPFQADTPQDIYNRASRSRGFVGAYASMLSRGQEEDGSSNAAEDIRNAARLRQMQQADVLSARQSQVGGDIVRATLPDVGRFKQLVDQQKALQDVINNPAALEKMGVTADQAHEALDRLNTGLATFQSAAASIAQDSALTIQGIQAQTLGGRLAADYQKTYAETLRSTHDALEAAARAEAQRNEAIATANKQAEDAARQQRNSDALLGLKPAQRLAAERQQALEDAKRTSGGSFSLPAVSAPGGGALSVAPGNIRSMIDAASAKTGVDARIIAAIGQIENGFKLTGGTSLLGSNGKPSSAYGYGQLTNGAAADVAQRIPGFSKYDPNTAVLGAATYFKILTERNGGNLTEAANAYGGTPDYAAKLMRRIPGALAAAPTNDNAPSVAPTAYGTNVSSADAHYSAQVSYLQKQPLDDATEALKRQQAALDLQRQSFGASAEAAAVLAEKQNLLNTYQASGITVTDQLMTQIDAQAAAYGRVAKAQDDLDKSQQRSIGTLDTMRDASKSAFSGLFSDLRNGATAGQAFSHVLDGLLDRAFSGIAGSLTDSLFGKSGTAQGGSLGGGLAGMIQAFFHHDGGIVGSGLQRTAVVNPLIFAGAPRHHGGYGLAADERPAILQTGEAVISRADLSAARAQKSQAQGGEASGAANSNLPPIIHNYLQPGQQMETRTERGPNGQHVIHQTVVDSVVKDLQSNGPIAQVMRKRSGIGRVG